MERGCHLTAMWSTTELWHVLDMDQLVLYDSSEEFFG